MTLDTGQLKARHGLGRRRLRVRLMATTDAWSRSRGRKRRAQALQRRQRHALGLGSHGGSAYGCVIIRPHAPRGKGDAGGAMLRSDPSWRQCADASGHQCISKKRRAAVLTFRGGCFGCCSWIRRSYLAFIIGVISSQPSAADAPSRCAAKDEQGHIGWGDIST